MPIPAIIPAIIAAAGAIGGAGIQAASAKKNRISQEKQNAIDRTRAATAYQTAVSDMRAAGMNPITGQNPPQAAATPMPAPQSDMTGVGQVVQQGAAAVGDLLQRNQQALQDQAMSFYQNQVNSTNDMINKLQDIVHQYQSDLNQTVSGLTEDAKAYLNEETQKYISYSQKISSIEDSRLYSVEDLKKTGIKFDFKSTNGESHSRTDQYGGSLDFNFSWSNPITSIVDGVTEIVTGAGTSSEEKKVPASPGKPSQTTQQKGQHNESEKKEREQKRQEKKNSKGIGFDVNGEYNVTKTDATSKQTETGLGIDTETTHSTKYVSGKTLKNQLMEGLSAEFQKKTQDSGSNKINESLKSIDRNSYIRLVDDLVKAQIELTNNRRYAADLKRNPGNYLESYPKFIDGLKSNNENVFVAPSTSGYEQQLKSSYLSGQDSYPVNENFKKKFPKFYEVQKELDKIKDPSLRNKLYEDFLNNIKNAQDAEYFKKEGRFYVPKKFSLK